jgi:hypothetical protein
MTAGWVAGSVRARALARRRLGRSAARDLAASPSLDAALAALAATPYGHAVQPGQRLAAAQGAVAATLLWHLRVLAGWLPRQGAEAVRRCAGWFEIANVDELLARWRDGAAEAPAQAPFHLGALATAWPRLARAGSAAEVRAELAASPWGDPGSDRPRAVQAGMRLSWLARLGAVSERAVPLAAGAAALLVARERFGAGQELPAAPAAHARRLLGAGAVAADSFGELRRRLPARARWALRGVEDVGELWRAEAAWWGRVERDGFSLLGTAGFGLAHALGAVAVLGADAWRVRAALEIAARGGRPLEAFDALA